MNPFQRVNQGDSLANTSEPEILAIRVIAHIASDQALFDRFLDLNGLTGDELRAGIDRHPVQVAALDFLAMHEADLISVADAIGVPPESLMQARNALETDI